MMRRIISAILSGLMILTLAGCGGTDSVSQSESVQTVENSVDEKTDVDEDKAQDKIAEKAVENDQEESEEMNYSQIKDAISAYEYYLGMGGKTDLKAIVDAEVAMGYCDEEDHTGESYSFEELYKYVKENRSINPDSDMDVKYSFLYPELQAADEPLLALCFTPANIYSDGDNSEIIAIMNYVDGELHVTYSYCSWCRNTVTLGSTGMVSVEGSGGAGYHVTERYYIDENGKKEPLYEAVCLQGNNIMFEIGEDVYLKAYGGGEIIPNISVTVYTIGDEKYYSYEYEDDSRQDEDQEFIDSCDIWTDKTEIDSMISDRASDLGISYYNPNEDSPLIWNDIFPGDDMIIPMQDTSWSSMCNYQDDIGTVITDKATLDMIASADMTGMETGPFSDGYEFLGDSKEKAYLISTYDAQDYGQYSLYLSSEVHSYVLTPDNTLMYLGIGLCDLIYDNLPEVRCYDYDNDGFMELSIISYIFHGTGFSQRSLTMIDRDEYNYWHAYHLSPARLTEDLMEHARFAFRGKEVVCIYDGVESSVVEKEDEDFLTLNADQFVDISEEENIFKIYLTPMFINSSNMLGIYDFEFLELIEYAGEGNWNCLDFQQLLAE